MDMSTTGLDCNPFLLSSTFLVTVNYWVGPLTVPKLRNGTPCLLWETPWKNLTDRTQWYFTKWDPIKSIVPTIILKPCFLTYALSYKVFQSFFVPISQVFFHMFLKTFRLKNSVDGDQPALLCVGACIINLRWSYLLELGNFLSWPWQIKGSASTSISLNP